MKNFLVVVAVTAAFAAVVLGGKTIVISADAFRFSGTTGGSRTRLQHHHHQQQRGQYFVGVIKSTHQTINCRNYCYDRNHHPSSSFKLFAATTSRSQTAPNDDDDDDDIDIDIDIESQCFDTQGQQNRQWLVETFNCTKESLSKRLEPTRYNTVKTSELIYRANFLKKRLKLTDQEMNQIIQRRPTILRMTVESKLGPILDFLEETFGKKSLKKMIIQEPNMLQKSLEENLKPKLVWLRKRLGYTDIGQVRRILIKQPSIVGHSISEKLEPNLKWLEERLSLSDDQIAKIVGRQPQILCSSVSEKLEPNIEWIKEKLSLSNSDLANMVASQPSLLYFNITTNLDPTIKFYMDSIETDEDVISFIVKDPAVLTCSLKNRLEPRLAEAQEAGLIIDVARLRRIAKNPPADWDRSLN